MKTKDDAVAAMKVLREFISLPQRKCLSELCRGEEQQFFFDKLCDLADTVKTMPVTYKGRGMDSTIHLHYFNRQCHWWITEKDAGCADTPGQHQAWGHANLNGDDQNAENGYISIVELLSLDSELDLYWTPITLKQLYQDKYEKAGEEEE